VLSFQWNDHETEFCSKISNIKHSTYEEYVQQRHISTIKIRLAK
jgi:hypothetical protein